MRPPGAWVYLVALRYLRARRAHGGSATFLLASLGIAVGTAALIVVLGVMNGFQSGFIDSILEVDSHHIRIKTTGTVADPASTKALASRLTADPRVSAALPFADYEAVALGRSGGALPLRVKAVPQDAALRDPALKIRLSMVEGEFPGRGGLVLGAEIARQLDVFPGDEVSLLSVGASGQEGVTATVVNLRVDGIFRSGHYAFDIGLGFMTFGAAVAFGEPENLVLGVKLRNRFGDESF
ncbi:MAG TPA: ABC transporter permease, partial [Magnetospirillaceae bacterium]|nr:ABC transporter permease [Magnetospirillaceae bacterium]